MCHGGMNDNFITQGLKGLNSLYAFKCSIKKIYLFLLFLKILHQR